MTAFAQVVELRDDEARMLTGARCGTCCHLLSLHADSYDDDLNDQPCVVPGCFCSARALGPPAEPVRTGAAFWHSWSTTVST